jgi:hypothetical protein
MPRQNGPHVLARPAGTPPPVADRALSAKVRLSVNMSAEVAEALREIADRHGCSITEAIRRCISTQKYLEDAADRGAKILLDEPGQPLRELVFVVR